MVVESENLETPKLTVKDVDQKLTSFMEEVNEMRMEFSQQLNAIMV